MAGNESKRKTRAILVIALAICLVTIATTAAYFVATINATNQEATVTTGTMSMTFRDKTNGVNAKLMFGESVTKEFTIENTGTLDVTARMSWLELVNTYIEGSLTYKLEYAETDGGTYTEITTGNVPVSATESTQILASGLTVPAGKTYYYKLTITLENLDDVDQTADLNATFKTKFTIEEDSDNFMITFNAQGGNVDLSSKTVRVGMTYGNLPTPTNDNANRTFVGWYTSETGGTQVTSTTTVSLVNNQTLYARWQTDVPAYMESIAKTGTPNFATIATTNEGIYSMADNYGTSYYYRGAVEDNYVKFGKYADTYPNEVYGYVSASDLRTKQYASLEECNAAADYNYNCTEISRAGKDMYWRIIRTNGDGSLRMIYDGTQPYANGVSNADRTATSGIPWNETNYNDAKYVGYMYGGANGEASTTIEGAQTNETSSNAKTQLEAWYKTNIADAGYSQYIADVIFCNDRSTAETAGEWWTRDTTLGYGTNVTAYGAFGRFYDAANSSWDRSDPTPTFVCPTNNTVESNNDWFTAEATTENKGNGDLDYPVGLITLDESAAAGGKIYLSDGSANNSSYYLYKGHWYWSLSPGNMGTSGIACVFRVYGRGTLLSHYVYYAGAVAPVINLSAEYASKLIGTGTMTSPYTLENN